MTYANVAFGTLLAILAILLLLVYSALGSKGQVSVYLSGVILFVCVEFLLTLLMVVRRSHDLLFTDLAKTNPRRNKNV